MFSSKSPKIMLWPPGHCLPLKLTHILKFFLYFFVSVPLLKVIIWCPNFDKNGYSLSTPVLSSFVSNVSSSLLTIWWCVFRIYGHSGTIFVKVVESPFKFLSVIFAKGFWFSGYYFEDCEESCYFVGTTAKYGRSLGNSYWTGPTKLKYSPKAQVFLNSS